MEPRGYVPMKVTTRSYNARIRAYMYLLALNEFASKTNSTLYPTPSEAKCFRANNLFAWIMTYYIKPNKVLNNIGIS